jgi:raffinose/stachyose/melibiose transport system permease protein
MGMERAEATPRIGKLRTGGSPLTGYLMVLPAVIAVGVFMIYPIGSTVVLSFHRWPGVGERVFVGFANYVQAFSDPIARRAFLNNVLYSLGIVVNGVVVGLILANLLASGVRGRLLYQTIFFFPRLVTQVVVAVVWSWIFHPRFGLVNAILRAVGLGELAIGWLGHPTWALPSVLVAAGWTYFGFCMVIFMAALQSTNPDLKDAAYIDGAGAVRVFFQVILPQIRPVIVMVVVYTIIDSFKVFDIIYLMTGGGPGDRTQIMATYLYRESFRLHAFGYGATLAVILGLFVVVVAVLFERYRRLED